MSCTNDLTPIITQVAIALPIMLGILATWLNLKISQAKQKAGHDVLTTKVEALTEITVNGFHSPPNVILAPDEAAPPPAPPARPGSGESAT